MKTTSRITLSTVLGLSLVGLCLGSAHAQAGMKKDKKEANREMKHVREEEEMEDGMMSDYNVPDPAPLNYPFASPGGLHLYHWTDYGRRVLAPDSATSKREDNEYHRDKMMHERLAHEESMWTDDQKKMMREPAPINYPFAAPAGLHLYHYSDYSEEGISAGSSTMKAMDNEEMKDKMVRERMRHEESMWTDDQKKLMREPAPIGYPFSAPGGLQLYHYTDYSEEGIAEGSATMKQEENAEKREKKMMSLFDSFLGSKMIKGW